MKARNQYAIRRFSANEWTESINPDLVMKVENTVAMKRCLEGFVLQIRDDFDDACSKGMSTGKSALDDIFDRYFLSCVQ